MKFFKSTQEEEELKMFYMQFIKIDYPIPKSIIERFKNDLIKLKEKNIISIFSININSSN